MPVNNLTHPSCSMGVLFSPGADFVFKVILPLVKLAIHPTVGPAQQSCACG